MKIRWLKTAIVELEDIFLYINERNRPAARRVVRHIKRASLRLVRFPFSGKQTDEADSYELLIIRYPYAIYYAVDLDLEEVVILHIRHTPHEKSRRRMIRAPADILRDDERPAYSAATITSGVWALLP